MRTKGAKGKPKFFTVTLEQLNKVYGPQARIDVSIKHLYQFAGSVKETKNIFDEQKENINLLEELSEKLSKLHTTQKETQEKINTKIPFTVTDFTK